MLGWLENKFSDLSARSAAARSAVRRDIFVENQIQIHFSPVGAASLGSLLCRS